MTIIPEYKLRVKIDKIEYDYLDISTSESRSFMMNNITVYYTYLLADNTFHGGWKTFKEEMEPDEYRKEIFNLYQSNDKD
jgi:hypothetical protein